MELAERVNRLITPTIEAMGFEIVRIRVTGGKKPCLQIMAERSVDGTMVVEDCAKVSRAVSAVLDVEDPISGAYMLEVSSPGIDRPLVREKDYERFAGFEAKIETVRPVEGRKHFKGRILGIEDAIVSLATDEGTCGLAFDEILKAKLVLTDDLIAAATSESRQ
ncbi:MAG: ribosome maturation factor RimP [Rhodospirillaceae bacterium]|nr:ribosome maturation factor RimP [Rhodospirillaceae bacterium]